MAKKKEVTKDSKSSCTGGCLKNLVVFIIFIGLMYIAGHIYFLVKPADKVDEITKSVSGFEVMGVKLFPGVNIYTTEEIDGRTEALNGEVTKLPELSERLKNAVTGYYPVTFREDELNAWLSKRLLTKQGGLFGPYVEKAHTWIDLTEGQMSVSIEREFINGSTHVTSVLLKFTRFDDGYSIQPYSAQIGQVTAPGGFALLVMEPFKAILEELSEELLPYTNHEIKDIYVEEGKITLDPRRADSRSNE